MNNYVSIVIVSHSEKIATGIKDMIEQIAENVTVEIAGGTNDGEIGTNLNKINEAVEKAYSPKGVLVFYDMGSAKMNAQFALELNNRENIYIIDVPLVEGAYIAAVKASIGKSVLEIKENLLEYFQNFFQNV